MVTQPASNSNGAEPLASGVFHLFALTVVVLIQVIASCDAAKYISFQFPWLRTYYFHENSKTLQIPRTKLYSSRVSCQTWHTGGLVISCMCTGIKYVHILHPVVRLRGLGKVSLLLMFRNYRSLHVIVLTQLFYRLFCLNPELCGARFSIPKAEFPLEQMRVGRKPPSVIFTCYSLTNFKKIASARLGVMWRKSFLQCGNWAKLKRRFSHYWGESGMSLSPYFLTWRAKSAQW